MPAVEAGQGIHQVAISRRATVRGERGAQALGGSNTSTAPSRSAEKSQPQTSESSSIRILIASGGRVSASSAKHHPQPSAGPLADVMSAVVINLSHGKSGSASWPTA